MAVAYLLLGSNIGDKEENIKEALLLLREKGIQIKKVSSLYLSAPWGYEQQEDFLNLAVEVETNLPPRDLLAELKEIERRMGRKETFRWGPRKIDIDILLYEDLEVKEVDLVIPHPRLRERLFALLPLQEIAPCIRLPDSTSPFAGMEELAKKQKVRKYKEFLL